MAAMNIQQRLSSFVNSVVYNDRFASNLTAVGAALAAIAVGWLTLRWLLGRGIRPGVEAATGGWQAVAGKFQSSLQAALGWLTFAAATGTVMIGMAFHLAGHDIRADLTQRAQNLTWEQIETLAWCGGKLLALLVVCGLSTRIIRRLRAALETRAAAWLGKQGADDVTRRWFLLLERYALAMTLVAAVGGTSYLLGLGGITLPAVGFAVRVMTILVAARLLTLAARALMGPAESLGDRRLRTTRFVNYWQSLTGLIPLGVRCFEAAVYVCAASLCVKELHFIAFVADYGPKTVQCIGIFFGTRVAIELLQVLLAQLFGVGNSDRPADQKRQTLAPLVQSGCQYLLYFGAVVMMMDVWGQDTKWLLASAGILGLAVGLGAQNLVTDIVSGFFILFEGQFLVGDTVQVGGSKGVVEAIAVRHTQIRDEFGHLHIVPNGTIKQVVNQSKGYVNVVVDVQTPLASDVEGILRAMAAAGETLRRTRPEVLAMPEMQGVVGRNLSEITLRAVARVRPGTQLAIEQEYRRLVQQQLQPAEPKLHLANAA
ncbi:MAG: mechanosensitive ion channel family protein [Pirellulales bacterium]